MIINTFIVPSTDELTENLFTHIIAIDVLRASTTVCNALFNGAKEIIPFASTEDARLIKRNRREAILGGERHGLKPEGFDLGNSPLEYSGPVVRDKQIILTTTNGTKLFRLDKVANCLIVGSLVNNSAVVNYITAALDNNPDIVLAIICAGNNDMAADEDTLCAGMFVDRLINRHPDSRIDNNSSIARSFYLDNRHRIKDAIMDCNHSRYLAGIGFEKDIEFATDIDRLDIVPICRNGVITSNLD